MMNAFFMIVGVLLAWFFHAWRVEENDIIAALKDCNAKMDGGEENGSLGKEKAGNRNN